MTTTDGKALTFPAHWIPLKWAAVCVNHDKLPDGEPAVYDVRGYEACPACASASSTIMLTEWLKAKAGVAGTGTPPPEPAGGRETERIIPR